MPGPDTYKLDLDWSKNPKGKFLKGNRVTQIDAILKMRKLNLPGPGKYKMNDYKIMGLSKTTGDKCVFINEAKFKAHQTPGFKYKLNYVRIQIIITLI